MTEAPKSLRDIAASLVLESDVQAKIDILKRLLDEIPTDEKNSTIVLWNVSQTFTDYSLLRSRCSDVLTTFSLRAVTKYSPLSTWQTMLRISSVHNLTVPYVLGFLPRLVRCLTHQDLPRAFEAFVPEYLKAMKDSVTEPYIATSFEGVVSICGQTCESRALCRDIWMQCLITLQGGARADAKRTVAKILESALRYVRHFKEEVLPLVHQQELPILDRYCLSSVLPELLPPLDHHTILDAVALEAYATVWKAQPPFENQDTIKARIITLLSSGTTPAMTLVPALRCLQTLGGRFDILDAPEWLLELEKNGDHFVRAEAVALRFSGATTDVEVKVFQRTLRMYLGLGGDGETHHPRSPREQQEISSSAPHMPLCNFTVRALLSCIPQKSIPHEDVAALLLLAYTTVSPNVLLSYLEKVDMRTPSVCMLLRKLIKHENQGIADAAVRCFLNLERKNQSTHFSLFSMNSPLSSVEGFFEEARVSGVYSIESPLMDIVVALALLSPMDRPEDLRTLHCICTAVVELNWSLGDEGTSACWHNVTDALMTLLLSSQLSLSSMCLILRASTAAMGRMSDTVPRGDYERWVTILHAYLIACADVCGSCSVPGTRQLPRMYPQSETLMTTSLLDIVVPPTVLEGVQATYRSMMSTNGVACAFRTLVIDVLGAMSVLFRLGVSDASFCTVAVPHSASVFDCIEALAPFVTGEAIVDAMRSLFVAMYGVIPNAASRCLNPNSLTTFPSLHSTVLRPSSKVPSRIQILSTIGKIVSERATGDLFRSPSWLRFLGEMAWWDISVKTRAIAYSTVDPAKVFYANVTKAILSGPATWRVYGEGVMADAVHFVVCHAMASKQELSQELILRIKLASAEIAFYKCLVPLCCVSHAKAEAFAALGPIEQQHWGRHLAKAGFSAPCEISSEESPSVNEDATKKKGSVNLPLPPPRPWSEATIPHVALCSLPLEELRNYPDLFTLSLCPFPPAIAIGVCEHILDRGDGHALAAWLAAQTNHIPQTFLTPEFVKKVQDGIVRIGVSDDLLLAFVGFGLVPFSDRLLFYSSLHCLRFERVPPALSDEPQTTEALRSRLAVLLWMIWQMEPPRTTLCAALLNSRPTSIVDEVTYDGFECLTISAISAATWLVENTVLDAHMTKDLHNKYTAHLLNLVPYLDKTPSPSTDPQLFLGLLRMCVAFLQRSGDDDVMCLSDRLEGTIPLERSNTVSSLRTAYDRVMTARNFYWARRRREQRPLLDDATKQDIFTIWYTAVSTVLENPLRVPVDVFYESLLSVGYVGVPEPTQSACRDLVEKLSCHHGLCLGAWTYASANVAAPGSSPSRALVSALDQPVEDRYMTRMWVMAALQRIAQSDREYSVGMLRAILDNIAAWCGSYLECGTFLPMQVLHNCYGIALENEAHDEQRSALIGVLWAKLSQPFLLNSTNRLGRYMHCGLQTLLKRYQLSHQQRDTIYSALLEKRTPLDWGLYHVTTAVIISTNISSGMEHARVHAVDMLGSLQGEWTTRSGEMVSLVLAFLLGTVVDSEHAIFLLLNKFLHDPLGSSLLLSLAMPRLLTMNTVDIVYDGAHSSDVLPPLAKLWVTIHLLHALTSQDKQPLREFALPYGSTWHPYNHPPTEVFTSLVRRTKHALRGVPDLLQIFDKLKRFGPTLRICGGAYATIAEVCEKGT